MKRRSFFSTIATAVAGFAILPPATTYARIWKARKPDVFWTEEWDAKYLWSPKAGYGKWTFEEGSYFNFTDFSKHPFALDQGNAFRRVET